MIRALARIIGGITYHLAPELPDMEVRARP